MLKKDFVTVPVFQLTLISGGIVSVIFFFVMWNITASLLIFFIVLFSINLADINSKENFSKMAKYLFLRRILTVILVLILINLWN